MDDPKLEELDTEHELPSGEHEALEEGHEEEAPASGEVEKPAEDGEKTDFDCEGCA